MKQNLLKEMETGSKNALLKKRIITQYIYNLTLIHISEPTIRTTNK